MSNELVPLESEMQILFKKSLSNVRDEIKDNTYIEEALRVLPAKGYRSAIGSFWNAVVDDLTNKIIHRSLSLFNKTNNFRREIKSYDDFYSNVNDDELIDGAYKIGVIGLEASKILKHAKETRHIFYGHPKSSEPSIIKVLAMFEDCIKYVLNEPYPPKIIDINDYLETMNSVDFDRNEIAASNAIEELPEIYKSELINRIFQSYIIDETSTEFRSNIEFIAPILWKVLPKEHKSQIIRKLDGIISESIQNKTKRAFKFVQIVDGQIYLSASSRNYIIKPLVNNLKDSLDSWENETKYVSLLKPYASYIPNDLLNDYVSALTHSYVGYTGNSRQFARSDFYADGAVSNIKDMFALFDDNASIAFIDTIKESNLLQSRIQTPSKLNRLRTLGNIISEKVSTTFNESQLLDKLIDTNKEKEFFDAIK
ncbi:hypothetical protein CRV03_01045 [Arcobacter sp. F155]|uniref:hypothetical protein n=1 Tax=Arcobacter sp. F155 TaxID=2044512 RepID=UPI00100BE59C|nr:hypothetical protein [Arcobacter sp. F155]RXJ78647.1 hypothetical protein CRV03_01045 [Arcobacter sp. F155]